MKLALALFSLTLPSAASAGVATTGAVTLSQPVSARAAGFGEAYAAVAGGAETLGSNPAGAAQKDRPDMESTYASGVIGDSFGFIGWAQPTRWGAALVGVEYYDAGNVQLNFPGGSQQTVDAERDEVVLAGWALPLFGGLSAGVLAKGYHFDLAQQAGASGWAVDGGLQWSTPIPGLRAGAALQNVGPNVKFEQQGDPLPRTTRVGLAWAGAGLAGTYYSAARFLLTADGVKVLDSPAYAATGAEFALDFGDASSVALRGGWTFNRTSAGLCFGIGVREGRYRLDYALQARGQLGTANTVSLGLQF